MKPARRRLSTVIMKRTARLVTTALETFQRAFWREDGVQVPARELQRRADEAEEKRKEQARDQARKMHDFVGASARTREQRVTPTKRRKRKTGQRKKGSDVKARGRITQYFQTKP